MNQIDQQVGRAEDAINTNSNPSDLRITDMRLAVVAANYDYPILRIDTNQGIYGLGEVRDAGHAVNALQFKSMLVGQNPCNVDMIFRTIKRFGNWGREGGGVSGIEIALMDLIGKVYGVPCYQLLGGKHRDRVRLYGDTPTPDQSHPRGFRRGREGPPRPWPHLDQVRPQAQPVRNRRQPADRQRRQVRLRL